MSESSPEETINSYYVGKGKRLWKTKRKVFVHSKVYLVFLSLYGTYDFVTDVLLVVDTYGAYGRASKCNNKVNKYNVVYPQCGMKNEEK